MRCIPLTRLYNTPYYDVESMGGFLFFSFRVFRLFLRIPFWPPSWVLRPYDVRVTKMTHTLLLIESSAIFSPVIWFSSVIDYKRTTNVCESFHNQFGSMFYNSHPNIFEFMEKLKCTQTRNYLKIRASNAIVPLPKREKERIDKLLECRRRSNLPLQQDRENIIRGNSSATVLFPIHGFDILDK